MGGRSQEALKGGEQVNIEEKAGLIVILIGTSFIPVAATTRDIWVTVWAVMSIISGSIMFVRG